MKHIPFLLATLALSLLLPSTTLSVTIHVPSEQPTIQLGIEATAPGDTVLVANGTYSDCTYEAWCSSHGGGPRRVCFAMVDSIHVIGNVDDPGSVIVDAGQSGGVIFSEGAHGASIEGLTISGGSTTDIWNGSGGGLFIYISSLEIRHCIIRDNTSPDHGGGVQCVESTVNFNNCVFQNNSASTSGAGIYATNSTASFTACDFIENSADGGFSEYGGGGGIYVDSSQFAVSDCSFSGNTAANRNGGGLVCYTNTGGIIENTSFFNNSSRRGGAAFFRNESSPTLINCSITGNSATESGGGLSCVYQAYPIFEFSEVRDNTAPLGSDGYIPSDCSVELHCCDAELAEWAGDGTITINDENCCILPAPILSIYESPPDFRLLVWDNPEDSTYVETCVYRGDEPGFDLIAPIYCADQETFVESYFARHYYVVKFVDINGYYSEPSNEVVSQYPTPVPNVFHQTHLEPPYPNPFNPSTTAQFNLDTDCRATVAIYDLNGELITTLVDELLTLGPHSVVWPGTDGLGRPVAAGTYLCRLKAGGVIETRRITLVK